MIIEKIKRKTFDSLPEYSCSIPTGTIIGKVWRSKNYQTGEEFIREYLEDPTNPDNVLIQTRKPEFIDD